MSRYRSFFVYFVFGAWSLSATLLTSQPPGGTTTTFPGGGNCFFDGQPHGPFTDFPAPGFSTSNDNNACYPYGDASDHWTFDANGTWDIGLIGDASHATTITIELGGLYSYAGGFMNYNPAPDPPGIHPFIAVLAADMTVLEIYDLSIDAPISTGSGSVDDGAFRGIDVGSPQIAYFQFGGSASALHDLTLGTPEPATAFTAAGALVLLGLLRRRRR